MKIVQTCWLKKNDNQLSSNGGWLSPEYHWMSWALSCFQLTKFYIEVELYANEAAIEILINKLQLPYSKINIIPDTFDVPVNAWALSKIYTYSQQKEPFLHVDGDIFIWQPFDNLLLDNELIAQNEEVDFLFYAHFIDFIQKKFDYVPAVFLPAKMDSIRASNAGVLGGHDVSFFQEYTQEAIRFVNDNKSFIDAIEPGVLCMTFEQLLFFRLAKEKNKEIKYLFSEPVYDSTYPGMGNFYEVPYLQKFVHTMGEYKRKRDTCIHLAKRLRKEYPVHYYRILRNCLELGIALDNQAYTQAELSPLSHDVPYYEQLRTNYLKGNLEKNSWLYLYAKDVVLYEDVETIYSLDVSDLLEQILLTDADCSIIEIQEPVLEQRLYVKDIYTLTTEEILLDGLNMILLDSFSTPKSIKNSLEEISVYFSEEEIEGNFGKFQALVLDRIKELFYRGALDWRKSTLVAA